MSKSQANKADNLLEFSSEHCEYKTTYEKTKEKYIFTCSKTNKSPLAGTKYIGHFVSGKCMNVFNCVSGCNSGVPKTLIEHGSFCD